jgi:glucose/arabinose dehydrogenase
MISAHHSSTSRSKSMLESGWRITCLASAAGALALATAMAQQPSTGTPPTTSPVGAAPPTWSQGRKPEQEALNLAPHPPALAALAPDEIPIDKLKVPDGFRVSVWASGAPNARSMTFGKDGTLFVGTRFVGTVYAIVDRGDRREVKTLLKGLHRPNGLAFKNGSLYVAEVSRILRYDNIESHLDDPPPPVVVFDALPKDEPHGWKFMTLGPDGWLYFQIGSPGNILVPPVTHAQIARVDPDRGVLETVASGVRNSVGMDFHPATHELWFTNNGRDWLGDDVPNDTLHRVTRKGMNFGFPFCHQGDLLDDELGKGRSCKEFDAPALKLGPHVAPLGMRFYTGRQFPAEYRNNIFIAEHGSWNRTKKVGFNVSRVVLDDSGQIVKYEPFATGFLQGESFWGRPVDVQVAPDGALLVSDDIAGAIYRIAYPK